MASTESIPASNTAASRRSGSRQELWARTGAGLMFVAAAAFTLAQVQRMSASMSGGMRMPGGWVMSMFWMGVPGQSLPVTISVFLLMWLAMMVAMMLPSSWPMLELYRKTASSSGQKRLATLTLLVGTGYFAVWTAFGGLVFTAGSLISVQAMRSAAFSYAVPLLAGCGLIFAGIYQISPWKQACLRHCRSPLMFLGHVFEPGARGALRVGLTHGLFCLGCCWALMLIQAILGVMNLGAMILVAALIGAEKLWTRGPALARVVGVLAILAGAYFLTRSLTGHGG